MNRRQLLGGASAGVAALALVGCASGAQVAGSSGVDEASQNARRNPGRRHLIRGGFVYAADAANTVIPDGWVLVDGDTISAVGAAGDAEPSADTITDAPGKLVLPGLVNAHWHESFGAPNFETPDDTGLEVTPYAQGGNIAALGAMFGFISTVGGLLTPDEALAIARWSMWTQLRSGTTALGDIGSANTADAMGQAALDLGMRIRVSRWGSDIMIPPGATEPVFIADTAAQIADWEALMATWDNHPSGLVGGMPSILGGFGSSDAQLIALRDIAERYGSPYAAHLAPLRNESAAVTGAFGRSSVARFAQLGLLTDRLLAVHTAYASEPEYQQILSAGVNINFAPAHYGMLGEATVSETKMIGRFLKDGANVSCSTDGDITYIGGMPEAMRAAHLGLNEAMNDNTACPPTMALAMGSRNGAAALGWGDRIGSIEPGMQADLVLIDIDDWRYRLGNHPLRTFLVAGGSKDVDTVMVAGRVLIEGGASTMFDEAELARDCIQAARAAQERIGGPG